MGRLERSCESQVSLSGVSNNVGSVKHFKGALDGDGGWHCVTDRQRNVSSKVMKKLQADPVFAAEHAERMKKRHADPEFKKKQSNRSRNSNSGSKHPQAKGNRADDPVPGRKALDRLAQRITPSAYGGSKTQDQRVQTSYPQPYAGLSSLLVRRIDGHRLEAARTSGLEPTATFSAGWRWFEQLPGTGRHYCAAGPFPIAALKTDQCDSLKLHANM